MLSGGHATPSVSTPGPLLCQQTGGSRHEQSDQDQGQEGRRHQDQCVGVFRGRNTEDDDEHQLVEICRL